jgi:hypothetical protein
MKNFNSKSISTIVLIYVQLSFFIALTLCFYIFSLSVDILQNILVFVLFQCLLISFFDKFFNVYQIFLFMMFLFNAAIPVFSFFDLFSFPSGNRIMLSDGIELIVSEESLHLTYQVLISMILGSSVGWLIGIFVFDYKNSTGFFPQPSPFGISLLIKRFFILLLILMILRGFYLLYNVKLFGYINVMHLGGGYSVISSVLTLIDLLFKVTACAILYQCRSKVEYIRYASLVMIPFFIQAATGARGETIAVLIVLMFIYSNFFNTLKIKFVLLFALSLFTLAIIVGSVRFGGSVSDLVIDMSIFDLIINRIISTSGSMGVIAYTIEIGDDFFNSIPFLFGYFESIFSFTENYTYSGIQEKNYLAQHLIFMLNPEKLYRGSTIGTAMGAEFYEFSEGSMIIIFIMAAIMIFLSKYLINIMYKNIFLFYIGFLYLENLFMSPRGSIMKIFNKESVLSIAMLFLIICVISLTRKSKEKS